MVKVTEVGMEVFPGITIPWDLVDGFICGIIEGGNAEVLTDPAVATLDTKLQEIVDNTFFQFVYLVLLDVMRIKWCE